MNFKEPERFWSKVNVGEVDECWEWQASKNQGYGQFNINYRMWGAHRVAWVLTYGPIPEGLFVCHKCDNSGCCNPYHLFLGTNKDNLVDAAKKGYMGSRKLTGEEVLEIRDLYATGEWTHEGLSERFGVCRSSISYILSGRTWGWLEEETDDSSTV